MVKEFIRGFRPLDGESISKHDPYELSYMLYDGFRPLDGESISKHKNSFIVVLELVSSFPSPRRGINF